MATWVQTSQFSKVMDAIKEKLAKKLDASGIKNNLTTEDSGYVLDARAGKTLGDRATTLETKVGDLYFDTDSSGNWGFKSSKNGAVKSFTATGAASTIESSNLTASKALVSDANGKVAASSTTTTELGYLHGVTSSVQEQMNSLNSNLTNVSTAADNINLYVGDDGKLHWVNKAGADSALNFSSGYFLTKCGAYGEYNSNTSSIATAQNKTTKDVIMWMFSGVSLIYFHVYAVYGDTIVIYDNGEEVYRSSGNQPLTFKYEPDVYSDHNISAACGGWCVIYPYTVEWANGNRVK